MSKFKFSDEEYNSLVFHLLSSFTLDEIRMTIEEVEEAFAGKPVSRFAAIQMIENNVNPYNVVKYLR